MPKKPERLDFDQPWVSNYPVLDQWLKKHRARCMQQLPIGSPRNPQSYMEQWQVPSGTAFWVLVHADRHGWDIFTSVDTNNIATTLADAETRLDVAP